MSLKGRNILIKVNGTSLLGLRAKSVQVQNEIVDITTESDENANGSVWRVCEPSIGNRTVMLAGSGVFVDDTAINLFEDLSLSGDYASMTVEFENGDYIAGDFEVTMMNYIGEQYDAQIYSIQLDSVVGNSVTLTRYTYTPPPTVPVWSQRGTYLLPAINRTADNFGFSVSLSSDAQRLAVGIDAFDNAYPTNDNNGKAVTFTQSGGNWSEDTAFVDGGTGTNSNHLGSGIAFSSDASVMIVGERAAVTGANDSGRVRPYYWTGSAWAYLGGATIPPPVVGASYQFGYSVACSSSGYVMAVGMPGYLSSTGRVYVYDWSGSAWVLRSTLTGYSGGSYFGRGVALSSDGAVLVVGAQATQDVYVYDWTGSAWNLRSTVNGSDTIAGDSYGTSVALSKDGLVLAVGAENKTISGYTSCGCVYTYDWNSTTSTWDERSNITTPTTLENTLRFGSGVALDSLGDVLAVGARNASPGGRVYTFDIGYV